MGAEGHVDWAACDDFGREMTTVVYHQPRPRWRVWLDRLRQCRWRVRDTEKVKWRKVREYNADGEVAVGAGGGDEHRVTIVAMIDEPQPVSGQPGCLSAGYLVMVPKDAAQRGGRRGHVKDGRNAFRGES